MLSYSNFVYIVFSNCVMSDVEKKTAVPFLQECSSSAQHQDRTSQDYTQRRNVKKGHTKSSLLQT